MTARLEVFITFIVYLFFFGWIGWKRGAQKEFVVFLIALGSWLLLQTVLGDLAVRVANLGGKFVAFIQAGGLSANPDPAFEAIQGAAPVVTEETRQGYFFVLWVVAVVLAYVWVSNWPWLKEWKFFGRGAGGWAILFGIANGLVFASVFLPRLVTLIAPADTNYANLAARANIFDILRSGIVLLLETFNTLWSLVEPVSPVALLILLTIFLALAAGSLRSGARAKS